MSSSTEEWVEEPAETVDLQLCLDSRNISFEMANKQHGTMGQLRRRFIVDDKGKDGVICDAQVD